VNDCDREKPPKCVLAGMQLIRGWLEQFGYTSATGRYVIGKCIQATFMHDHILKPDLIITIYFSDSSIIMKRRYNDDSYIGTLADPNIRDKIDAATEWMMVNPQPMQD